MLEVFEVLDEYKLKPKVYIIPAKRSPKRNRVVLYCRVNMEMEYDRP